MNMIPKFRRSNNVKSFFNQKEKDLRSWDRVAFLGDKRFLCALFHVRRTELVPIPLELNILLIIFFILAGMIECGRLIAIDKSLKLEAVLKKAPYLYILLFLNIVLFICIILLMVIQLKRPSLFWLVPLWLQYYYTPLTWAAILSVFAFIFSLASAISFRTRHRERWKILIAGFLFVAVVQITQWNYTRPIAPHLKENLLPSGFILQSSDASCAAASAANIVRLFGIEKTEKEMAEILGTTLFGTTAAQIIYGMRKIGFDSKMIEIPEADPEKVDPPAMFFFCHPSTGPESHVVAYMGINRDMVEIWDPFEGKVWMKKEELIKIWRGRGIQFRLRKRR